MATTSTASTLERNSHSPTLADEAAGHVPRILSGQRALVTGASSGIGQAVAVAFARAGANVAVNYAHGEEGARETAAQVGEAGTKPLVVQADVSKEAEVRAMFAQVTGAWGGLDILVANAGIQQDAPLIDMTLEQWQRVIDVNLTGQFLCLREAVRQFRRQGVLQGLSRAAGKIICMSSVHDVIPWTGHVNYTASKGGISMLMKSVAQEVAPMRIRVNAISPGAIRTPLNRPAWETKKAYDDLMRLIPYNRIGEPEDIGRAAVWLASDLSDYVTGETLYVDGGMTLFPAFEHGG
ncbi:MAG TPA: SDR family oxidoreductase [Lacunisphaera sp.]|jgi:glucose 1-dehydrogenase|nr:SDR family oxidoreductase [Lacunisphaera sp.]